MIEILLPILSTIFRLTTLLTVESVSAQTMTNDCHNLNNYSTELSTCDGDSSTLTPQKWQRLAQKYYRTRYRKNFQSNNSFLSLKEVNNLLGFPGKRNKVKKGSHHQYLTWKDPANPHKKIEAVFIYDRLVGLRSRGFDRSSNASLK